MTKEAGGGTIEYVAEMSFKRKSLAIATPKETRSFKNQKVVAACAAAVKAKLGAQSFDGIVHQHARYKVAITASYPGAVKP